MDLDLEEQDFLDKQSEFEEKARRVNLLKGVMGGIGGIMQNQADVPTAYEYLYDKKMPRTDFKGTMDRAAGTVQMPTDPAETSKKAMEYMKSKREGQRDADDDKVDSPDAIAYGTQLEGLMPNLKGKVSGKMSLRQMRSISPLLMAKFNAEGEDRRAGAAAKTRAAEKLDAKTEKLELDKKERTTPFGIARTADDAKNVKSASELKANFDSKLAEMIELRKKHGGGAIMNRDDVNRGKALSDDLLLAYKDLSKLGVMSKTDEAILRRIIPADPLQYNSPLAAIQGQDPTMTQMEKFKTDSDRDFQTRLKNRLENYEEPAPTAVAGGSAAPKAAAHPQAQKALEWAKANAGTPEAQAIFQRLGVDPNTAVGSR